MRQLAWTRRRRPEAYQQKHQQTWHFEHGISLGTATVATATYLASCFACGAGTCMASTFDLYRLRRRHVFGVVQTTNVCTNCEAGKYSSTGVSVWWWRTGFTGGWASATRVPQAVLTRVPQAVFAGSRVTLVVTEAGKLWAWGQGAQGRLGLNEGKAGWCRRAWNRSTLPTHPSPPLPLAAPTREAKLSAHDCTMLRT